jgi:hypothetical protein
LTASGQYFCWQSLTHIFNHLYLHKILAYKHQT